MKNRTLYIIASIAFILTFAILGLYESDLLFTMQNYSYYSSDESFYALAIEKEGPISMTSRYILQFFYHPEIASLIMSFLLTATGFVTAKLIKAEGLTSVWAFIPQALFIAVISFVNMENISFITTSIFSALIAYIMIVWILALAKKVDKKNPFIGANIVFIASLMMVWYSGIYGVLPIICYALIDLATKQKRNISYILATIVVAIFIINCVANNIRILSPLPDTYFAIPFTIILMVFILTIGVFATGSLMKKEYKALAIVGAILFCLFSATSLINSEKNFRTQCSINRDLENFDFKRIIERVDALESPTEANMAYRAIALEQTDKLVKSLFKATPSRSSDIDPYRRHLADFCLYAGSANDAIIHAIDNHLILGHSFGNIKTMAIAYLLNGEINSAKKMFALLSQGKFYSEWANQTIASIKNIDTFFNKYPQFSKIKKGAYKYPVYIYDQDNVLELYERSHPQSPVMFERLLLSLLYKRDLDSFSGWMLRMASLGVKNYKNAMPEYFQEAACLCALKGNSKIINEFPVSPQIRQRVQKFATLKQNGESEEEIAKKIGRSYLTYFFFAPTLE